MFRVILYLLLAIVVISMLRGVIGIIGKLFSEFVNPAASSAARRPAVPSGGELKKDPVCGTFISASTAIQKKSGGEVYYFCSPECRDKFRS
ncbi:MAG TPA: YHS domain-containing protein [Bryobacteraceae bacterium]|nr:YHS domain-containing protein [Bryobacteraceae bacterium]